MAKQTVLIVEDECLIRMMLAEALLDAGFQVVEAENVLKALAALSRYDVHGVVTDIDMPGTLTGLDLAKLLSGTRPDLAVIITSGGHELRDDELPAGARFVPKPYGFEEIARLITGMTIDHARRLAS